MTGGPAASAILFNIIHLSEPEKKLFAGFERIIEWRARFNSMIESSRRSKKNCRKFGLKAKYYYIKIE